MFYSRRCRAFQAASFTASTLRQRGSRRSLYKTLRLDRLPDHATGPEILGFIRDFALPGVHILTPNSAAYVPPAEEARADRSTALKAPN